MVIIKSTISAHNEPIILVLTDIFLANFTVMMIKTKDTTFATIEKLDVNVACKSFFSFSWGSKGIEVFLNLYIQYYNKIKYKIDYYNKINLLTEFAVIKKLLGI